MTRLPSDQGKRGRWDSMSAVEQFDYVVGLEAERNRQYENRYRDGDTIRFCEACQEERGHAGLRCLACGYCAEGDPDRGLYEKFYVERTDGRSAPGEKHEGCRYFVLDLNHDPHAPAVLRAYAAACRDSHPLLAEDLDSLVSDETELGQEANDA